MKRADVVEGGEYACGERAEHRIDKARRVRVVTLNGSLIVRSGWQGGDTSVVSGIVVELHEDEEHEAFPGSGMRPGVEEPRRMVLDSAKPLLSAWGEHADLVARRAAKRAADAGERERERQQARALMVFLRDRFGVDWSAEGAYGSSSSGVVFSIDFARELFERLDPVAAARRVASEMLDHHAGSEEEARDFADEAIARLARDVAMTSDERAAACAPDPDSF